MELLLLVAVHALRAFGLLLAFRPLRTFLGLPEAAAVSLALGAWACPARSARTAEAMLGWTAAGEQPFMQLLLVIREPAIGFLLGFPLALALEALPHAGRLIDTLRGVQAAEQLLPGVEERASQLELLGLLAGLLALFSWSGLFLPLRQYRESFHTPGLLPLTLELPPSVSTGELLTKLAADALSAALYLAAPVLLAVLLLELLQAVVGRAAPALRLANEVAAAKLFLGIYLLSSVWAGAAELAPAFSALSSPLLKTTSYGPGGLKDGGQ